MLRLPVRLSLLSLLHDGKEVWSLNCSAPISCGTPLKHRYRLLRRSSVLLPAHLPPWFRFFMQVSLSLFLFLFPSLCLSMSGLFFCCSSGQYLGYCPLNPFLCCSSISFCLRAGFLPALWLSRLVHGLCACIEHGYNADIICQHQCAILNTLKLLLLLPSPDTPTMNKVL